MSHTYLSEKAVAICFEYYDSRCGKCPLREACVRSVKITEEELNKWREGINQLADEVKL